MKILITGTSGFIGKNIKSHLNKSTNEIHSPSHSQLDLCDFKVVENWFNKFGPYDWVIHTAIKNGNRVQVNTLSDLVDNLLMFTNLVKANKNNARIINFCSGAAFDREKDLWLVSEEEILSSYPKDFYGLSKNLIAKEIYTCTKIYNLRLFGCFGVDEPEHRLIKSVVSNVMQNKAPVIHQNRYMDFFYIKDLLVVLDYLLEYQPDLVDMNLVYLEKENLLSISNYVCNNLNGPKPIVLNKENGKSYTGNGLRLAALSLSLKGLWKGIEEVINHVKTDQ